MANLSVRHCLFSPGTIISAGTGQGLFKLGLSFSHNVLLNKTRIHVKFDISDL